MKRAIIYHNQFSSDGANFSTCGTKYEILPGLYPDTAGVKELREIAKARGLQVAGVATIDEPEWGHNPKITEAIRLRKKIKHERGWRQRPEYLDQYIGFIKLIECDEVPAKKTINNTTPKGLLYDLLNSGSAYKLGIEDAGESVNGEYWLIMSDWRFYHWLPLLGYSLDKFLKRERIDDTCFYDSVNRCSECDLYDYADNGYDYNHRDGVGINCGCYKEYAVNNIQDYVNKSSRCVESDVVETLQERGRVKFIQRYVGGMTDADRSHYYGGEYVSVGSPETILDDLLKTNPDGKFIFCHDESGQFQTYFSVYQLMR